MESYNFITEIHNNITKSFLEALDAGKTVVMDNDSMLEVKSAAVSTQSTYHSDLIIKHLVEMGYEETAIPKENVVGNAPLKYSKVNSNVYFNKGLSDGKTTIHLDMFVKNKGVVIHRDLYSNSQVMINISFMTVPNTME